MHILIKILTFTLNFIYFFIKILPTKEKVVMISRQANEPSRDFKLLKEALNKSNPNIEVRFLCRTLDGGLNSSFVNKIKYAFHMLVQMKEIATSKVVVLDTYCIVISLLRHKNSLIIIQMWHSIGTMKKFGYTALDTAEGTKKSIAKMMKMHEQYDYVLASSPVYAKDLARGFNCSEDRVKIMPLPRVDLLKNEKYKLQKQEQIYKKYPQLKEKKVILYAPTFRKDESEMQEAVKKLSISLKDNHILILKLHPLSKVVIDNSNVLSIPEYDSFELLFIADALISDYSCIIYEAALLNIPLYFYNFDMYKYTGVRGLAIDYKNELPGVISDNPNVLINSIDNEPYDYVKLKDFCNKYVVYHENASKKIAAFIISNMR